MQFSFHFWSIQKNKSADNARLAKDSLAFSGVHGIASFRMKPTVSHFEACKHYWAINRLD